ncbi:MAG: hypothetical protein WBD37_11550 [Anderseniella sp.]
MAKKVKIGNHSISVPGNKTVRVILGYLLIVGGLLGFLPVLGFWMVPLGLVILSIDSVVIRRLRRRMETKFGPWLKRRFPKIATFLGLSRSRAN